MAGMTIELSESVIDAIAEAVVKKMQEPKTGWIPVSERLPEDGTWNLWTNGKQISIERFKLDAMNHFYPSGRWFSLEEAIAWQPLPEPYMEGE